MSAQNKVKSEIKTSLHPRNLHRSKYNFDLLVNANPELVSFVFTNAHKTKTIDFSKPQAVRALNKALLLAYYELEYWDIPPHYLCPPVPGRADYIHNVADLLSLPSKNINLKEKIKCLDIGTGANCIYPIIGARVYDWSFVGSEIDPVSIESAQTIIDRNPLLHKQIEIRQQTNPSDIFFGIIKKGEKFDATICNPPFHASAKEVQVASIKKTSNLSRERKVKINLNFGGQNNELWCKGGERKFVLNMIRESKKFSTSCFWFTTLISKKENLKVAISALKKNNAFTIKTIDMGQGNKISRIIAWTFLTPDQQKEWMNSRWT